jgi:DNA-binding transcriptional LysR family regulator
VLLRQLEYLTALARERHFARAAAACHVSQPSLSAGIAKLEAELKVAIVVRGNRFGGFTPEGERVVVWARRILAEADALREDLGSMRGGLTGVLRVAAIPTAMTTAPLLTSAFCAEHPQVRVSLESASSREIVQRLADFDLDVGMTYVDGEPLGDAVRVVPLYREQYLLLTPDDGELGDRTTVSWAEVARTPLCLLVPEMQNRRILDGFFAQAGAVAHPAVETDTVSALYGHVGTHRWSTVIAHVWLHLFGVPAGMRVVPLDPPRLSPQVGLVLADRDPEPILAEAVVQVAGRLDLGRTLEALLARYLPPA